MTLIDYIMNITRLLKMLNRITCSQKTAKLNKIVIEPLMSQLLNIEIMDLHTRLLHIEKNIEKIKNTLENTVRKSTISLFLDYYIEKDIDRELAT